MHFCLIGLALAVPLALTGCLQADNGPVTLTVGEIETAVQDDLQRFAKTYDDKQITVIGYAIDKGLSLALGSAPDQVPGPTGGFYVECEAPQKEIEAVELGAEVTVEGILYSTMASKAAITSCSVVSSTSAQPGSESQSPQSPSASQSAGSPLGVNLNGQGIIVLYDTNSNLLGPSHRELAAIDPTSGKSQIVRSFEVVGQDCSLARFSSEYSVGAYGARLLFDRDYRRVAATCKADDGQHVGWVDELGKFVDVTAALSEGQSGYYESHKEDYEGKFFDNWFYFWDKVANEVKRVPITDLNLAAVEVVDADPPGIGGGQFYTIDRDGSVPTSNGRGNYNNWLHGPYGSGVGPQEAEWVSDSTFIAYCSINGKLMVGSAAAEDPLRNDCDRFGWTDLLQDVSGRRNWNPAVSPDRATVAFQSYLVRAQIEVYVVPVGGGDPVQVYQFPEGEGWLLIDWR
ncbi:MAG: hypothetical protein LBE08_07995 [Bifidobacteriaceae bacterium]|nr:hypothetical protein [Bifidobacteriaceae bacterium]